MSTLAQRHCSRETALLDPAQVQAYLSELRDWYVINDGKSIQRQFRFKDYEQTLAFVNAVAGIARGEDHHPDISFGYNRCEVRFSTHSVNGLSENDFICAARIDALSSDT
ncbi:4a-hydroxytetrahydrobiopterin dehydratase [Sulfuriflexus sp.]|uniref:4a-hydroxytetrahydrobiopterin dehydratase n=1 Tax=Sulfuriflexus sp. TaxID=2015443 RepID=UPI0028CBDD35|nr:4a-hydroxytetrahydrobiopterin dehydratase [Sulfuriflexus sp.]MDT8405521.1 4a-hydroxytetrahydrobiopterin dehydratase [Sulfuriflexus sp.]